MLRIGQGIDFHRFGKEGRDLVLGGILIPFDKKITAHSDGDIILHALMDAFLGAMGLDDIGCLFPDNDSQYENISSIHLMEKVLDMLKKKQFEINNIDITFLSEKPKIASFRDKIKDSLSFILNIPKNRIGLKATTTEKMGFIGREEGFGCSAVVLIIQKEKENLSKKKLFAEKEIPDAEEIIVYTDGACLGNPGPGGWGVVINGFSNQEILLSGGEKQTTNNRMEIKAVIQALEYLQQKKITQPIQLYTDSQYVKKGISEWVKKWQKNGWINSQGKPVLNRDLWEILSNLDHLFQIHYHWLKGHNGHPENEKCDEIARREAEKFLKPIQEEELFKSELV